MATRNSVNQTLDPAGNLTGDGTKTYVYNQAGRLAQVRQGASVIATYFYNHMGQRTRKVVGATTTVYHYDPQGHLIAETSGAGAAQKTYVWREDTPIAQIEHGSPEVVYYLHADYLDTPRYASDSQRREVWRWESDAFGTTAANGNPDGDATTVTVNLRFPGQYFDAETGFHYNWMRTYDPASGRYLESDLIGLIGGLNTYAYVVSSPTGAVDPSGLASRGLPGVAADVIAKIWRWKKLRRAMGDPPASLKKPEIHHDYPQKWRELFERKGIDIDDPKNCRWVEGSRHRKWSRELEDEWQEFLDRNPDASPGDIDDFMDRMRKDPRFQ